MKGARDWLERLWRPGHTPVEPDLRILFVCTGNICRSPTAEAVARKMIRQAGLEGRVEVESAGTHGLHAGEAPDPRTRKAALLRGYDLSRQRARMLEIMDFQRFDLLLAMDQGHYEIMMRRSPPVYRPKIRLFMSFARQHQGEEVPDPYYGGVQGFERVLDMCEDAVAGLLAALPGLNKQIRVE
jgi:low molecular weight protein-tyrosine phosphatase